MAIRLLRSEAKPSEVALTKAAEPKLTHRNFLKVLAVAGLAGASQLASPPRVAEAAYSTSQGTGFDGIDQGLRVAGNVILGSSFVSSVALQVTPTSGTGFGPYTTGILNAPGLTYSAGVTLAPGIQNTPTLTFSPGTTTTAAGMVTKPAFVLASGVSISTLIGQSIDASSIILNGGTITTAIGLYVLPPTQGTVMYGLYVGGNALSYFNGPIAIGNPTTAGVLNVAGGQLALDNGDFAASPARGIRFRASSDAAGVAPTGGGVYLATTNVLNLRSGTGNAVSMRDGAGVPMAAFNNTNGGTMLLPAGGKIRPLDQDSTAALGIANYNGTTYLNFDSTNQRVGVGRLGPLSSDSTTALQILTSAGTAFVTFDSTNQRVGVGVSPPLAALHLGSSSAFQIGSTKIADSAGCYYG